MLSRLYQWWLNRRRVKYRAVFRYWDGMRWRWGDPMRIHRRLLNHPKLNPERDLPCLESMEEPGYSTALAAIRDAFDVYEYDSVSMRGLTEAETIQVLRLLIQWIADAKKKLPPGPTSLPPTAGESSPRPEPAVRDWTGNSSAAYGGSATAPTA